MVYFGEYGSERNELPAQATLKLQADEIGRSIKNDMLC